jgi:hypothetical protein
MYRLTPPDSRFIDNRDDPAHFSEGTTHLRYLMKWALAELDYQSQRGAIALSFDNPVAYFQFLTEQLNPSLLALHNILPSLSNFPSGNTEAERYLRQKLRQSFEQAFEAFLAVNQRLLVSELPMFSTNSPDQSGLLKQVANDFLSLWKGVFEQILLLTDDVQQAKAYANNDGTVTVNLKLDMPESYQQLIQWLTEQAEHFIAQTNYADTLVDTSMHTKTPRATSTFPIMLFGMSLWLVGLWFFFHFWPTSFWAILFIGFIWLFFKHPLYVLAIWLGFSMGS